MASEHQVNNQDDGSVSITARHPQSSDLSRYCLSISAQHQHQSTPSLARMNEVFCEDTAVAVHYWEALCSGHCLNPLTWISWTNHSAASGNWEGGGELVLNSSLQLWTWLQKIKILSPACYGVGAGVWRLGAVTVVLKQGWMWPDSETLGIWI